VIVITDLLSPLIIALATVVGRCALYGSVVDARASSRCCWPLPLAVGGAVPPLDLSPNFKLLRSPRIDSKE
jgi:hypothetical protein